MIHKTQRKNYEKEKLLLNNLKVNSFHNKAIIHQSVPKFCQVSATARKDPSNQKKNRCNQKKNRLENLYDPDSSVESVESKYGAPILGKFWAFKC